MDDRIIHYIQNHTKKIFDLILSTDSKIINLYGESGTGKSYLLQNLYKNLVSNEYKCIILKGDTGKKEIDYYPFDEYLEKIYRIKKTGTIAVTEIIAEIPVIGKSAKAILEEIADHNKHLLPKDIFNINTFQIHEEFSLQLFSLLSEHRKVVIICDDIQYFDLKTITYLYEVYRKLEIDEFSNVHIINSINTSVQSPVLNFLESKGVDVYLPKPDRNMIREIIKDWGYNEELSEEMLEVIHVSTGGHLYLLKCIAEYLYTNEIRYSSHLVNKKALLVNIIETRLKLFGNKYDDAKKLFCLLSLIGEQTSNTEIYCLMEESGNPGAIIKESVSLNLLTTRDDYIYFSHEIVKKCFDLYAEEFSDSFFQKYSICIKEISPSHYAKRAVLMNKSNKDSEADIYFTLYAVQKLRKGLFAEIANIRERLSSPNKKIIISFINDLSQCYKLLFNGHDIEALDILYTMPDSLPYYLLIEKQYLICLCQYKSNNIETRKDALDSINEIIVSLEKDELEIWARCMFLKFALEGENFSIKEAKTTRTRLINTLSKRIFFDKESARLLNKICLYSDVIDPPELSHKKLISLTKEIEEEINNQKYDSILELYIAETNLSGNALMIAEYDTALNASYKAIKLMNDFSLIHFSHREVCHNNLYLSLFFKNEIGIEQLTDKYKEVVELKSEEDTILIQSNFAGFLISGQNNIEALNIMEDIQCDEETDVYYLYYYLLNFSIIIYLNGRQEAALSQLADIEKYIDSVSPCLGKYYKKHYKLLYYILQNDQCRSLSEIQQKFEQMQPVFLSPVWEKFKKAYLFSDLQIWTEF